MIWLARYLGPERLGVFNYCVSLASVFGVFGAFGAHIYIRRELLKHPGERDTIISSALLMRMAGGAVAYLALASAAFLPAHEGESRLLLIILGLTLINQTGMVFDAWFQAQVQSHHGMKAILAAFFIATGLRAGAILAEMPLAAFAAVNVIETIAAAALLLRAYRRVAPGGFQWRPSKAWTGRLFRESLPLYGASLLNFITLRMANLMLKWMAGTAQLGYYATVSLLMDKLYLIPAALASSYFPTIVKNRQNGNGNMQAFFDANAAIAWAVIGLFFLIGNPVFIFALGAGFEPSRIILSIHVFSLLFLGQGIGRGQYIVTRGYLKFHFHNQLLALPLNALLNLWLIPRYQGAGSALAAVLTLGIICVMTSFLYPPMRSIGAMQIRALLLPLRLSSLLRYARTFAARKQ